MMMKTWWSKKIFKEDFQGEKLNSIEEEIDNESDVITEDL